MTATKSVKNPRMIRKIVESAPISKWERGMFFGFSLHSWENAMVAFLIVAGMGALLAGLATWAVVTLQRVEIAEANARQAEAELKLEELRKQLGPRHLQRDIFLKEIAESPGESVEIMYLMDDPECFDLAQQIWRALEDAKWPVKPPTPIPPLFISNMPTAMSVGGQPSGVTVVTHAATEAEARAAEDQFQGRPWVRTPWTVLSHAIGDALGKVGSHAGGEYAPAIGMLRIVVAPR